MFTGLVSPNAGGTVLDHKSFRFWISRLVSEIFAIKVGTCVKWHKILYILAPFFGDGPKCLDLHNKIQTHTDHMAKFHNNRPMELEDPVAN